MSVETLEPNVALRVSRPLAPALNSPLEESEDQPVLLDNAIVMRPCRRPLSLMRMVARSGLHHEHLHDAGLTRIGLR